MNANPYKLLTLNINPNTAAYRYRRLPALGGEVCQGCKQVPISNG